MDIIVKNCDDALIFHKRMIQRAKIWAIVASTLGVGAISIGILLLTDEEIAKTLTTLGGIALTSIGVAWPLREIYNINNRIEALHLFRGRYCGPPMPSDEDKIIIKQKIDEIILKSF